MAQVKGVYKMAFQEVKIEDLSFNPFTKIGKEWLLITAGNEESYNTNDSKLGRRWCYVGKECGKCLHSSTEIHERVRRSQ